MTLVRCPAVSPCIVQPTTHKVLCAPCLHPVEQPPGYDAALERAEQAKAAGAAVGPGGEALPGVAQGGAAPGQQQQQGQQGQQGQQQQQQGRGRPPPPGGHLKNVLGGIKAVHLQQQNERYELKGGSVAGGRSPPRGGESLASENQQFVVRRVFFC